MDMRSAVRGKTKGRITMITREEKLAIMAEVLEGKLDIMKAVIKKYC